MTVETDLRTLLLTVADRVSSDFAPPTTARPYVTFQQVGGRAINYVEDASPDLEHAEFQVNVWGDTRTQVTALAKQIEAAMRAATAFTARPVAALVADFDADIPVFGTRQRFSVHSARAT